MSYLTINRALFALSNRTGPFVTPRFNYQELPMEGFPPEELRKLHARIFLDQTDTDYYLINYLALLQGFPEFMRVLEDNVVTYTPADFEFPSVKVSGGRFLMGKLNSGRVRSVPVVDLPVPLTYRLSFVAPQTASGMCLGTGNHTTMKVTPTTVAPGENGPYLNVDWPETWPFVGSLQLHQQWLEGAAVDLTVSPENFPWELWNQRLSADPYLVSLLQRQNLFSTWATAMTPKIKAAVALFSIVKAHPDVYPYTTE